MTMAHNGVGKPTVNGIVKGRPGKGKVLSLGQRKTCYAGHRMTPENIFRYHKREWCRICRADSRKRSRSKRMAQAQAVARASRKTAVDNLNAAFERQHVKDVKASKPKTERKAAQSKPKTAVARKEANAQDTAQRKAAKPKAPKVSGKIGCGECQETFPDPPTASKHFRKAHKGVRKAA